MPTEKDKTLEQWLWDAACSIRGAQEAAKYKDYILPLVFVKRLCDVFDDEINRLAAKLKSRTKAFDLIEKDKTLVRFYLPLRPNDLEKETTWSVIRLLSDKVGQKLTDQLREIAKYNKRLQGIIDRVDFNATTHGTRDIDDDSLSRLIERISEKRLGLNDVEADIIGRSYEYLIEKPTILMMIDRNELEDQLIRNLESVGIKNVEKAYSIDRLRELLKNDYRGIIVTMIHKFQDMKPNINLRKNIFVLVDEAHRTTQGDLGNYLMAAIPEATFIGFTGTPIDKTVYGKGTFKTFGIYDEPKGYLHKYSISESIEDGTTLPLYYTLAPNKLLVPKEILEKEFLKLAEAEGISDIDQLNRVLEKAVNTRNFLKGNKRVDDVAKFVVEHYKQTVEPLGYKAFLVGVDREACALYKKALDKYLPPEYSEVVYTGTNSDNEMMKKHHIDKDKEKEIRKQFAKFGTPLKILIVTEKLLTGYDAPILYAMYLDKPMRDHTLLQAIARVNRPYERGEGDEAIKKPHGFVLDFIGIFDKIEDALAFDLDDVKSVIQDLELLKKLFRKYMDEDTGNYMNLIQDNFTDKDTDRIIEYFKDEDKRKAFAKLFKEIEMLYEIISPDAYLRPFIDKYRTISAIYEIMRRAFTKHVDTDLDFLRKTNQLVREKVSIDGISGGEDIIEINEKTIQVIKDKNKPDNVKVINLIKSVEKFIKENEDDPNLISMQERIEVVQDLYSNRQEGTQSVMEKLLAIINEEEERKKEQAKKGFDGLTFFIYKLLVDNKFNDSDIIASKIKEAFQTYPNWKASEKEYRELRQEVTLLLLSEKDMDEAVKIVEDIFGVLKRVKETVKNPNTKYK